MSDRSLLDSETLTPGQVLGYGTLAVGTIEILDQFIFLGLRGVPAIRIPQSTASVLLGRSAFRGGMKSAAIGILIHYLISFLTVAVYFFASRKIPVLRKRPFLLGPLYGIGVWLVTNSVLLPFSRTGAAVHTPGVVANGLLIHAFGIGLIAALFAGFAPQSEAAAT